jgi:hypothetical protein
VSIYQFCKKQLPKLANLLMYSQCALSEPISSSRKTRKLTVCRFIWTSIYFWRIGSSRRHFARYVHVKNWHLLFYCSNIAKSENAILWRMLSRLETCIVYSCIWSITLTKSIVPRKTWRKMWHSYISKLFLTKMQVKFSIFFHHAPFPLSLESWHLLKVDRE